MKKRTLDSEYVSSFCLEMALLLHAGIGTEDGLYLLAEDETNKKTKKMLEQMAETLADGRSAAMTIGGAVTWGVMQHRIDEQYEEIAQDRKEILQDQQLLASLKGLEVGTSSAVSYMQTALSALDEVKTTWEGFYGVIENAVKELDKAEKSATAVLKQIFTETAKKQWADAHEMAEKLLDTKIQIEDKGVIGDKAA